MSFPRNCWYMACWAHDLRAGGIMPLSIAGTAIALYRGEQGAVAALEDRCPHKLAPLSMGQVEGDTLRCMYHGLRFTADGVCVEIPGQDNIPRAVCARGFPVAEAHSAIWLWIGSPEKADVALIPPFGGTDDPNWRMASGHTDYLASYRLINENLLDLSHVVFVHRASFGAGRAVTTNPKQSLSMVRGTVERLPRGVRQTRILPSGPVNPRLVSVVGEIADLWSQTDFLVPGIFLMWSDIFREGAIARAGGHRPPNDELLDRSFTCQAVTAMDARTSRYFFAVGPWARSPLPEQGFLDVAMQAFEEDRIMINAQQRVMDCHPQAKPKLLAMDKLGGVYAAIEQKFMASES